MGYITPEITGKFPGYLSPSAGLKFADIPNGLAAISKVPQAGWGQILLYMAYCEVSQTQEPGTAAYAGDFGFKVLTSSDPAEKTKKLNAEIANGRLAMMAIIGWFQIFAYCGFVEFSSGLGEDAWGSKKAGDVGWKPPFFSAGDDETKNRRLAAELANGRLAMMAIIGMFFQDLVQRDTLQLCATT
eukprot:s1886_g6.t1